MVHETHQTGASGAGENFFPDDLERGSVLRGGPPPPRGFIPTSLAPAASFVSIPCQALIWCWDCIQPPPPQIALSAEACPARQCPVASEMAWQAQAILGGRGVQTQATAAVAALPPPSARCTLTGSAASDLAGPSHYLRLDSQRSGGALTHPPDPRDC